MSDGLYFVLLVVLLTFGFAIVWWEVNDIRGDMFRELRELKTLVRSLMLNEEDL